MKLSYWFLSLILSIFFISYGNAEDSKPSLTIYTYSSFISDWGPGPKIEKYFEDSCECDVIFIGVEDGGALLNRLKIEGIKSSADVILGLDNNQMAEAKETGLIDNHGITLSNLNLNIQWSDKQFIPFDFGYFGFVYDSDRIKYIPTSLADLVFNPESPKIIIQDPRTSTPGLGLLLWMRKVFGDEDKTAWKSLSPKIVTVTKGWSEAYGLFLEEEAPMVLSYTTSPAYHRHIENTERYKVAIFSDGHYQQIELAAKLVTSKKPELATKFLNFLLTENIQDILPVSNWMLPVIKTGTPIPPSFKDDDIPKKILRFDSVEVKTNRKKWITNWLNALIE